MRDTAGFKQDASSRGRFPMRRERTRIQIPESGSGMEGEGAFEVFESLSFLVFGREDRMLAFPIDAQVGIVPQEASFALRGVRGRYLVGENGVVPAGYESVCHSGRKEELQFVFFVQFHAEVLPVGRRSRTEVYGHIHHGPPHDPYELVLREGGLLEMQPAQDVFGGFGFIVLDKDVL